MSHEFNAVIREGFRLVEDVVIDNIRRVRFRHTNLSPERRDEVITKCVTALSADHWKLISWGLMPPVTFMLFERKVS